MRRSWRRTLFGKHKGVYGLTLAYLFLGVYFIFTENTVSGGRLSTTMNGSQKTQEDNISSPPITTIAKDPDPIKEVLHVRNELMEAGLYREAYQYAKRKLNEHPNDLDFMALVGRTAHEYEKVKNPHLRNHWIDRLNVLHEGLEATHRCMLRDPEAWQCRRYFVLCAVKAADQHFYFPELKALSLINNWRRIHKQGDPLLEKHPTADVAMALGSLDARVARAWYYPYGLLQRFIYGLPSERELLEKSTTLHLLAKKLDPLNVENVARLAIAYLRLGRNSEARKWFCYVRDEMTLRDVNDVKWTSLAHTTLATHLQKAKQKQSWNLPFG